MEKRKVKVGVLGAGRGGSMIKYCQLAENAELVAICDKYEPMGSNPEMEAKFGHAGGDFYTMYYFCERILGDENAETIDIYEACDMFLPGLFAYKSIMQGNMPVKIPNFRNKEERDLWRNDTSCTDPKAAGDMLLPSYSKGNPDIPDSVYERLQDMLDNPVD